MPEYPEIYKLTQQMDQHLCGKTITGFDILQPKCLNLEPEVFAAALTGATIQHARQMGKWIALETDRGWMLLNLGMGGELLLVTPGTLPAKHRLVTHFAGGDCLSANFWWFGYVHYAAAGALQDHPMVGKLGPNVLEVSLEEFKTLASAQKGSVKALLLDQSRLAGIGNSYVHDMLFLAKLHPLRRLNSLLSAEVEALYGAVRQVLEHSLAMGGANYEMDLFGQKGGFGLEQLIIGYKEGQPCPECGTPIQKIKTGGTSGFICPVCQI